MKTRLVVLTSVTAAVVMIAGCYKLIGGGWFEGLYGGKAHFGFQMQCKETGEAGPEFPWVFWDGNFQFQDKSANVRFHGEFIWTVAVSDELASCEEAAEYLAEDFGGSMFEAQYASGKCRTQPGNVPGEFEVSFVDDGKPGKSDGDWISVWTNCTPDGEEYFNEGTLGGGNIMSVGPHKKK